VGFLKKLFGGGSGSQDKDGLYFYIQSNKTGEVIQVRLHRFNDLSPTDDFSGYCVHKVVVGEKGFDRLEAEFYFDNKRSLTTCEVAGGTLVDRGAYDAYKAGKSGAAS
jgi:hypothetical protein